MSYIEHDDQERSKPGVVWALDVNAPPLRVLEVIETAPEAGEPPSLHLFTRLPLGASPDLMSQANGWLSAPGIWTPRSFGGITRVRGVDRDQR